MKQNLGFLKNKTHTLNSYKENLRLKTNKFKGLNQSNPLSNLKKLIFIRTKLFVTKFLK